MDLQSIVYFKYINKIIMSNTNDTYYKKYIKYKNKYFLLKGSKNKNDIIDFNDIKIIKELGHGLVGTIYLVQDIKK